MQRRLMVGIGVLAMSWGCGQPGGAAAAPLRSGFYEGFVLAVSASGRVVGHFNMEQGEGVTKRCVFDFAGQASGDGATIRTLGSPALSGRLVATAPDEATFSMAHVKGLPGCGLVLPPEAETPAGTELDRIKPGSWTDLVRVKSARLAFRATPGGAPGRGYVVKGDVLGVLAHRGDAVQVVYPSERATWSQGWVSAADLAPIAP